MKNSWLGYASTALFFMAGLLMILGQKPAIGIVFILIAVASLVLNIYMNRKKN